MIRKLRPEDSAKVLQIWLDASLQAHDFISRDYWLQMLPTVEKYYLPNAETYVWEDKRQIKGFISLTENNFIGALFVAPGSQGQNGGSKLINYIRRRRPALNLNVFVKNIRARQFYQKMGFKIVACQNDPSSKEDELLMSWARGCLSGHHQRRRGDS